MRNRRLHRKAPGKPPVLCGQGPVGMPTVSARRPWLLSPAIARLAALQSCHRAADRARSDCQSAQLGHRDVQLWRHSSERCRGRSWQAERGSFGTFEAAVVLRTRGALSLFRQNFASDKCAGNLRACTNHPALTTQKSPRVARTRAFCRWPSMRRPGWPLGDDGGLRGRAGVRPPAHPVSPILRATVSN